MKKFIIKTGIPKVKAAFYMSQPTEFLYFYCCGLADLRKTLKCIMARGYRVHTARWYVDNMENNYIHIINRWFETTMYEIKIIDRRIVPDKEFEYTNESRGFTHLLKITTEKEWNSTIYESLQ